MSNNLDQEIATWSKGNQLYIDLSEAKSFLKNKQVDLATREWTYLIAVLAGYTRSEIAKHYGITTKSIDSCLNKSVYLFVERLYQKYIKNDSWTLSEIPSRSENPSRSRDSFVRRILLHELGYQPDSPIQIKSEEEETSFPVPQTTLLIPNGFVSYWGQTEEELSCFGRDTKLAELKRLVLEKQRRIIVIRGLQPSVGATTLAYQLAQTLESEDGYRIFWFHMETAPPLKSFIRQIVQRWASHIDLSTLSPAETFRQLLQDLREFPWLIVLDGVVPRRNTEKSYAIYNEYSQLFDPIQTELHQGCLLMTGRKQVEKLDFMKNRAYRGYGISCLSLGELSPEAVQEWLKNQNVASSNPLDYKAIHDAYSGNPSFIQFVIKVIQKNYKGNLARFNQERGHTVVRTPPMMDLVREQWQDLEEAEQQVCLQMAEQSKPLTLNDLEQLMQGIVSRGEIMGLLTEMQEIRLIKVIYQNNDEANQYALAPLIQRFITKLTSI